MKYTIPQYALALLEALKDKPRSLAIGHHIRRQSHVGDNLASRGHGIFKERGKSGSGRSEVIRRFLFIVRKNKDWPRLDHILQEVERQSLQKRGMRKVEVESTAPLSNEFKKEIEKILGKKLVLEERIRSELLAGIKILIDDEFLIDASARRRIGRLFK